MQRDGIDTLATICEDNCFCAPVQSRIGMHQGGQIQIRQKALRCVPEWQRGCLGEALGGAERFLPMGTNGLLAYQASTFEHCMHLRPYVRLHEAPAFLAHMHLQPRAGARIKHYVDADCIAYVAQTHAVYRLVAAQQAKWQCHAMGNGV